MYASLRRHFKADDGGEDSVKKTVTPNSASGCRMITQVVATQ